MLEEKKDNLNTNSNADILGKYEKFYELEVTRKNNHVTGSETKIKRIHRSNLSRKSIRQKKKEPIRFFLKRKNVFDSIDEDKRDWEDSPIFLIKYNSQFKEFWEIYMLFTIFYASFVFPIFLCFEYHILILDIIIDVSLILDIIMAFFTEYEDERENRISSAKKIQLNYLFGWFSLDLITCFPVSVIESFVTKNLLLTSLKWFSMLRLLKLLKYPYFINKRFISNHRLERVIKILIGCLILINICSSFFIFFAQENYSDNWIITNSLDSNLKIYLTSFNFHLNILYTVGNNSIYISNSNEKLYLCFIMVINFLIFPFILLNLAVLFVNNEEKKLQKSQQNIQSICQKYDVSDKLLNELKRINKEIFNKMFSYRNMFIETLPTSLMHLIKAQIYNHIKNSLFFRNQSFDFVSFVIPLLRHSKITRGYNLFCEGEIVESLYIVDKGKLSLNIFRDEHKYQIDKLSKHHYFGDVHLESKKLSIFNLECKTKFAEVFQIKEKDFELIKSYYPHIVILIEEKSLKKFEFLRNKLKKILHFIKIKMKYEEIKLTSAAITFRIENRLFLSETEQKENNKKVKTLMNYYLEGSKKHGNKNQIRSSLRKLTNGILSDNFRVSESQYKFDEKLKSVFQNMHESISLTTLRRKTTLLARSTKMFHSKIGEKFTDRFQNLEISNQEEFSVECSKHPPILKKERKISFTIKNNKRFSKESLFEDAFNDKSEPNSPIKNLNIVNGLILKTNFGIENILYKLDKILIDLNIAGK